MGMLAALKLLKVLQSGNKFTRQELANKLEIPERNITHYVSQCKLAGFDIKVKRGHDHYYQFVGDRR
ncbi:HTH domain-containing protein [Mycoplasmatota bacterium]|nr:HTH domain-containing protein [Mycoplasmatota bacterium]